MRENTEAADTPEGIARWWLGDKYSLSEVRQALEALVADGLITKLEGKDLQPIYRINNKG